MAARPLFVCFINRSHDRCQLALTAPRCFCIAPSGLDYMPNAQYCTVVGDFPNFASRWVRNAKMEIHFL